MFEKTLQQLQNVNSAFSAFRKRRTKRKNVRNFRDHSISSTRVSEQLLIRWRWKCTTWKWRTKKTIGLENARVDNDGQKLRGPENARLENDGQTFSKLWAQLRGLEMQESSWVQPTHTVYIKEAVRDTLQSSTGMSSHLQPVVKVVMCSRGGGLSLWGRDAQKYRFSVAHKNYISSSQHQYIQHLV